LCCILLQLEISPGCASPRQSTGRTSAPFGFAPRWNQSFSLGRCSVRFRAFLLPPGAVRFGGLGFCCQLQLNLIWLGRGRVLVFLWIGAEAFSVSKTKFFPLVKDKLSSCFCEDGVVTKPVLFWSYRIKKVKIF
jgi:hypothetical protein